MTHDEMKIIVICRHCGRPEYYGQMRWLSGHCSCRPCYRIRYKDIYNKEYEWPDLDGTAPTMQDYLEQQKEES